jgi:glycosyltransferase involved in cell wall biosynthesis
MLAATQVSQGHSVRAIALLAGSGPESPTVGRLRASGVNVTLHRVSGRAYLAERREFGRMIRGMSGIIHTHGYRADVVYGPVARSQGIPIVTTLHGFTGGDLKNRLYERLQRWYCRRFDRVVAVSRPIADLMRRSGVRADRLALIPNAYTTKDALATRSEARRRLGLDESAFVVGWVGRMSHEKAPDVFIEALGLLRDLPLVAVCIGDGPMAESSRARAAELGIADRVRFPGLVDGVSALYSAFDVFALSSRTEGTPIVLFEAMAAGVPVVATRVGGIPDVLSSGEGMLVDAEAPPQLAEAIRQVFTAQDAARDRAQRARRALKDRFSPEPWARRYEAVYKEIG